MIDLLVQATFGDFAAGQVLAYFKAAKANVCDFIHLSPSPPRPASFHSPFPLSWGGGRIRRAEVLSASGHHKVFENV